jgi:hypothetical protein
MVGRIARTLLVLELFKVALHLTADSPPLDAFAQHPEQRRGLSDQPRADDAPDDRADRDCDQPPNPAVLHASPWVMVPFGYMRMNPRLFPVQTPSLAMVNHLVQVNPARTWSEEYGYPAGSVPLVT